MFRSWPRDRRWHRTADGFLNRPPREVVHDPPFVGSCRSEAERRGSIVAPYRCDALRMSYLNPTAVVALDQSPFRVRFVGAPETPAALARLAPLDDEKK